MAYVVPTAAELKAKLPRFAAVSDSRVTSAIDEAVDEIPLTWRESDYKPGVIYLAAHIMVIDGVLDDIGGTSVTVGGTTYETAGALSGVKVGDVDVRFGTSGGGAGGGISRTGYASTVYGQRYLELLQRNTPHTFALVRA